ncbi:MAG TPA: glycosyltransferase family 4 protein [Casimicrobiaceae bacterium]|jgi:UDP-N-acetylmuramyl pentapeptide phosphotransferase/UDP-N-acetylglucosamine-1-phosphate transferase
MNWTASAGIAIFASWLVLALVVRQGHLPEDTPNQRSLHRKPVPRGGGIAIWAGMIAATVSFAPAQGWFAPLLLIIAVSWWDDRHGVPVALRLGAQIVSALAVLHLPGAGWSAVLALLAIVWMTNLYNFMDGSDGLAATMTVVGFGAYAFAGARAGMHDAPVSGAIAAATLPFFARNFPPARIFLGDVGAVPLGFMAAVLGIEGVETGAWPWWFPELVFLPFIADATITLLRRVAGGANVLRAHRDNYYQRLVRLGLGHRGTLLLYAALMLGSTASALAALLRGASAGPAVLALWFVGLMLLYSGIGYHWRKNQRFE